MISYLFIESVGVPPLNCYSVIIPPPKKKKKKNLTTGQMGNLDRIAINLCNFVSHNQL